ncbi:Uncharacterised protein [Corynebacterium renale]|uniref:hypothetical protein n=1 Tax=Corynebacterium renale TaxID=1724 RepID=UPI000DA3CC7E|nr:hypothetical protein [Corynebacterium renale]SQG64980.1 Uncharacterised protein [Corynebacterium renale]
MNPNADKATRLFQFLSAIQQVKEKPVRETREYLNKGGVVFTLENFVNLAEDFPRFVEVSQQFYPAMNNEARENGDVISAGLIVLKRPPYEAAPKPSEELEPWLVGDIENHKKEPILRAELTDNSSGRHDETPPQGDYNRWIAIWRTWANKQRLSSAYQELFELALKAQEESENFEIVLGFGALAWDTGDNESIDRHIFSLPIEIHMDKNTGDIEISVEDVSLRLELEGIPTSHLRDSHFIEDLREYVEENSDLGYSSHDFPRLGYFTANSLADNARFEDSLRRKKSDSAPVLYWAPAIILRPRQKWV